MSDLQQQLENLEQLVQALSKEVKELQSRVNLLDRRTFKLVPLGSQCHGYFNAVAYKIK